MATSSHEQSIEPEVSGTFLNLPSSAMADGMKIMEALSNEDAIALFFYIEKENVSSKEAMEALGLSQKRFYTRLKLLLDAGLVDKKEEGYQQTFMGTLIQKLGLSLLKVVENKEKLDIIDSIRDSSGESSEKTSQIAEALSIDIPFLDISGEVKMIESYDTLVKELVDLYDNCKTSLYLATKYTDIRVVNAIINAKKRGVKMLFLGEKMGLKDSLSALRMLMSPSSLKSFTVLLSDMNTILRRAPQVLYSFSVIDDKFSVIEVPHPTLDDFYLAFSFENEVVCQKIGKIFLDMWEKGEIFKFL